MSTETRNPLVALIVAPIVYALTLPTSIGVLIVNEILRRIVKLLLWFQYGHGVSLIEDGLDAFFHHKSNGNTRNVTVVGILDNDNDNTDLLDLEKHAQRFEKRVLLHEEVEQTSWPFFGLSTTTTMKGRRYRPYEKLEKIVTSSYGYYCWKYDDKFNVRRHFRVLDDDKVYTERDIMELLSTLTLDMDERKPQWEFIFVQRFQNSKGEVKRIQIFNFHHAYMDGLSLMMMLDRHLMDHKVPMQLDPMTIKIPLWKQLLYYINGLVNGPYLFLTLLWDLNKTTWVTNSPAPRGKKTFAWATPIDMDVMKKIRVKTKATIPNVVAQAFTKSIKEVLPPERVLNTLQFSEIVAIVPYPNADPQNRFSLFTYPVSTSDLTGSAEEFQKTIFKVKRQRTAAIRGPHPLLFFYMFKLCGRLPHFLHFDALDIGQSSIHLSNVPTFTKKISYFDSTCEEFCPFPPMPNKTGIMMASISYADHVKITGAADSTWLSQDEMERIFIEIPKVIHAMAELGYIPDELPTLKKVDQDMDILPVPEEEEEVDEEGEEKNKISAFTNAHFSEEKEEEEEQEQIENVVIPSSTVEVEEEKEDDGENDVIFSNLKDGRPSLVEPPTSEELPKEEEDEAEKNESEKKKEEENVVKSNESNDDDTTTTTTTNTTTTKHLTNGHHANGKKGDNDDDEVDEDEDQSRSEENEQRSDVKVTGTETTGTSDKETKVINSNSNGDSTKLNGNHKTEKKTKNKKKKKTGC